MKKAVLVLLLICLFSGLSFAEGKGLSNLTYGIIEGTKDLGKVYSTPIEIDYLKSALALTGTLVTSLFDSPVHGFFSDLKSLETVAVVLSKSVEPVGLGILYTTLGWNNKDFARKMIGSSLFTGINTIGLKYLVGKSRPLVSDVPSYIGPNFKSDYNAFPSGHTALSFNLATVLSSEYPEYSFWFYTWSSGVGLSRIILERHWISDVLGGAITGTYSANIYLKAIEENH